MCPNHYTVTMDQAAIMRDIETSIEITSSGMSVNTSEGSGAPLNVHKNFLKSHISKPFSMPKCATARI